MLTPADERPHAPPVPTLPRWQENYFVLGWDDRNEAGFSVHLERYPDRGEVEVKADVAIGPDLASTSEHHRLTTEVSAGPVTVVVEQPFERWRLAVDGNGARGRGPLGFVGSRAAAERIGFGLEAVLDSPLGAVDHAEQLQRLALPGTERDHYEAIGVWTGVVRVGDQRIDGSGHFVRDHTWGVRGYSAFDAAWWYPSCFDDGHRYVGGAFVGYGGQWGGYAIVADRDGVDATTEVAVDAGDLRPGGYDTTRLTARFPERGGVTITSRTRLHLPHSFPGFAERYFANDALSMLEWEGAVGFGVRELNGYLDPADAALIEPAAPA